MGKHKHKTARHRNKAYRPLSRTQAPLRACLSAKVYSPDERAAMTCGRIAGRATLAQVLLLARLGYAKDRAIKLTKHAASKIIAGKLRKG